MALKWVSIIQATNVWHSFADRISSMKLIQVHPHYVHFPSSLLIHVPNQINVLDRGHTELIKNMHDQCGLRRVYKFVPVSSFDVRYGY